MPADCECWEWMVADNILCLANRLSASGFIDSDDEGDIALEIARFACSIGCIDVDGLSRVRSRCRWSEQRRIVEEYARFARTTNDTARRAEKIRSLGVSPQSITRWAALHFGTKFLAGVAPPSARMLIVDLLRRRGRWMTRNEVLRESGIRRSSLSGSLGRAEVRGEIERRRGERGVYEYRAS